MFHARSSMAGEGNMHFSVTTLSWEWFKIKVITPDTRRYVDRLAICTSLGTEKKKHFRRSYQQKYLHS